MDRYIELLHFACVQYFDKTINFFQISVGLGTGVVARSGFCWSGYANSSKIDGNRSVCVRSPFGIRRIVIPKPKKLDRAEDSGIQTHMHRNQTAQPVVRSSSQKQEQNTR